MKRIIFSTFLVAGLLISLNGFSETNYGHRGGFGFHGGFGYAAPRPFFRPVPRVVIYPPIVPPLPYDGPAYGSRHYGHACYHRHYHRW